MVDISGQVITVICPCCEDGGHRHCACSEPEEDCIVCHGEGEVEAEATGEVHVYIEPPDRY